MEILDAVVWVFSLGKMQEGVSGMVTKCFSPFLPPPRTLPLRRSCHSVFLMYSIFTLKNVA